MVSGNARFGATDLLSRIGKIRIFYLSGEFLSETETIFLNHVTPGFFVGLSRVCVAVLELLVTKPFAFNDENAVFGVLVDKSLKLSHLLLKLFLRSLAHAVADQVDVAPGVFAAVFQAGEVVLDGIVRLFRGFLEVRLGEFDVLGGVG
jgi:hypothetical protein